MLNFWKHKYNENENFDTQIQNIKIFIDEWNFSQAINEIHKTEKIEKAIFNVEVKINSSSTSILNNYNNKIIQLKELKKNALIQKKSQDSWFSKLFGKKEVDSDSIHEFQEALKAINIYMLLSEWDKTKQAIKEIENKEQDNLDKLLNNFRADKSPESEKIKSQLILENTKKVEELKELKLKLVKLEKKYRKKEEGERFKIRFKIIKDEISVLSWSRKNTQALNLLQKFLEENKEKTIVIKFFNKEKKHILKNIEKEKKYSEDKIKETSRQEAMRLIWQTVDLHTDKNKIKNNKNNKLNFFKKIKEKLNFYKKIKESRKRKKLFDEINMLIEEDSKVKNDIAEKKLENIHKWLIKEISNENMLWYELYWKILGADKISWDTFGLYDDDNKYVFFLWDATWHWIRAWFIITLLSRLFNRYVKSTKIDELAYEINNWLKQDLKSRNFITWIFFEIIKKQIWSINFVWMWHEPMLIYRTKTATIEKVIPGWLAAWIRIIKDSSNVKTSHIELDNNDILITYSDWIVENKNEEWDFYWIEKLTETFSKIASYTKDINEIYEYIMKDVKLFKQTSNFDDDASILILKRNWDKDIQDNKSKYLKDLTIKEWLVKKDLKRLIWKNKEEIKKELNEIKKEKETKRVIKNLETLYYTWEILKLKQEAKRYINEGYIHKKINHFLKIAINKETEYKIEQKNMKMINKFNVLKQLEKKWDYNTVISEIENIIAKDWNI